MTSHNFARVRAAAWLAVVALMLLASAIGGAWALPGRAALGQTIPFPTFTATPTATGIALPTPTRTPRPTWTRMPTQPPELPTATPGVGLPTATQPAVPTQTGVLPPATATSSAILASPTAMLQPTSSLSPLLPITPSPPPPVTPAPPLPSPSAPALPAPLAFEVAVLPRVAGPGDEVQLVLQVANVGYGPLDGVQVMALFPDSLQVQAVDCAKCTVQQVVGGLAISLGQLAAGDQVIAPVTAMVAEDAWPGQTLRTEWTLTATGLLPQTAQASVELPWAGLPQTGDVTSNE